MKGMKKRLIISTCVVSLVLAVTVVHLDRSASPALVTSLTVSTENSSPQTVIGKPSEVTAALPVPIPAPVVPPPPVITAEAYLVGNAETGEVYVIHNPQLESPIASISKLFTAIVANNKLDPNQIITITQPMLDVYPNSYGFSLGEQFSVFDLMYPLLIQSNNNIAEGIAQTYGYVNFLKEMNALATEIGLTKTHFTDASGLSNENISNARDLFTFAQYLYKTQKSILALTATPSWSFATTSQHGAHLIQTTDPFVGDPHLVGGKTGRTDAAGETMLTIFNYMLKGKNYPIVIIVLHSDLGQRQNDSVRLLFQGMAVIQKQK